MWRSIQLLAVTLVISACQGNVPHRPLELPPESLAERQVQTRQFNNVSETDLLAACAGVLQDLGFNLDESETELGLIVASKFRTVDHPAKSTLARVLDLLVDIEVPLDKEQQIRASLVSRPDADQPQSQHVRVTFQRIVWNTENEISRREALTEPQLYQRFFSDLSKSVFLEENSL